MHYRTEIDGLRAVAVLPVILSHAGFSAFSGGFVGVDVFFVISGYLITGIVLADWRAGTFSVASFYKRRARRILPALLLVLLCCLPAAWVWLLPQDMNDFAKSLLGVSLFASNLFFWATTGYFDTASELKPLLHTWSLAVEEQFYLFFPLLALALARRGERWLAPTLAVLWAASFLLCTGLFDLSAAAKFFLLPSRTWELLTGALLAVRGAGPWRLPLGWRQALAAASVAMILYAVFALDSSTPFPGPHSLWPVLGAAGVLAFASGDTWVGRLLGSRPFVGVGLTSYSAYLWHQPVFAFVRHASLERPGPVQMAPWALLSLLLAWASWRFVEQPFRRRAVPGGRWLLAPLIAMPLLCASLQRASHTSQGFPQRFDVPAAIAESMAADFDRPGCNVSEAARSAGPPFCQAGAPAQTPSAAVFGDSHMALLPAFDAMGRQRGESLVYAWLGACPPLLDFYVVAGYDKIEACPGFVRDQLAYVERHRIKTVFLVGRWSYYTDGGYERRPLLYFGNALDTEPSEAHSREAFENAVANTIAAYRRLGVMLYWVEQIPEQRVNVKQAYYRVPGRLGNEAQFNAALQAKAVSTADHEALQQYNRQVLQRHAQAGEVRVIRLDSAFCDTQTCCLGDAQHAFYRDPNHLSVVGALHSADALMRAVPPR